MAAGKGRAKASAAAKKAAAGAARSATKGAARAATKAGTSAAKAAASAGTERVGRGTRWTEDQVALLLETVGASRTAKEAFEAVARELGKSTGTVQQKYYNLQKANGTPAGRRRGRPRGAAASRAAGSNGAGSGASTTRGTRGAASGGALPNATDLRSLTVDELVGLAQRVKSEVDRRRAELDEAARQLKG
ncbi:MAG: hypothetical protein JWM86_845 [Thermoleophilia bacterium]|nr:hypothetical protein [Thermoleophilia bacterium]